MQSVINHDLGLYSTLNRITIRLRGILEYNAGKLTVYLTVKLRLNTSLKYI